MLASEILDFRSREAMSTLFGAMIDDDGDYEFHQVRVERKVAPVEVEVLHGKCRHMHGDQGRDLTDALLDHAHGTEQLEEIILCDDWAEVASGWHQTIPNPKFLAAPPVRKRKNKPGSSTLEDCSEDLNNRTLKHLTPEHFSAYRLVPEWLSCVELETYSYVQNNGCYRQAKCKEKTSMQRSIRKSVEKLTLEQRHFQREIQRQLRKEYQAEQERAVKILLQKKEKNPLIKYDDHDDETEDMDVSVGPRTGEKSSCNLNEKKPKNKNQVVEQTANSETPNNANNKLNLPLFGKSFSDSLLEGFSNKLDAMEAELKRDIKIVRKNHSDAPPSRQEMLTTVRETLAKSKEFKEMWKTQGGKTSTGNSRTISIKCKHLKPVEKVTPYQRQVGENHRALSHLRYTLADMETRQRNSSKAVVGPNSKGPEKESSHDLNLDKTLTTKKVTRLTVSDKKGTIGNKKASTLERTSSFVSESPEAVVVTERFHSVPVGQSRQRERSHTEMEEAIPKGLLPCIAGKRLEVPVSPDRWV